MEVVDVDECIVFIQFFCFGQCIVDVVMMLLCFFKGEQQIIKGCLDIDVCWFVDIQCYYVLIGWINVGLFVVVVYIVMGEWNCWLYFVGGFDSYLFGKVFDVYYLWVDECFKIKDLLIFCFISFIEFQEYGEEVGDVEVKVLVKIVDEYCNQVLMIYNWMKVVEMLLEDQVVIILIIGYCVKGLEWEQVSLVDDFIELLLEDDFDFEEINFFYVVVMCVIWCVKFLSSLYGWLEVNSFDFGFVEVCQLQ